ncbi:MAG: hypothetical protein AB9900_02670 [Humidesulfovibrio sp.]
MIQYITRQPTDDEVNLMKLAMSTFCDGSGQEREKDGGTRPGWREFERIVAELLGGYGPENKNVFDVVVQSSTNPDVFYGVSLKSKQLSGKAFGALGTSSRVYMELCNSPAKLWDPLNEKGYYAADFEAQRHANEIGQTLVETVHMWHEREKAAFEAANPGKVLDLGKSVFLVISYSTKAAATKKKPASPRSFQLHSFGLTFPAGIQWRYFSKKLLKGYDPLHPTEVLFDWYPSSGGQLKYYPRAQYHKHCSTSFRLSQPREITILERAADYWPIEWLESGGKVTLTLPEFAEEIGKRAELFGNDQAKGILREAVRQLLALR